MSDSALNVVPGHAPRTANRAHFAAIDGMRAIAAVYVVLHHAWLMMWPINTDKPGPTGLTNLLTGWLAYGRFAVSFFIILSGFVLVISPAKNDYQFKKGWKDYVIGRCRRLLPTYYFALVLSLVCVAFIPVVTGTLYDSSLPASTKSIATHFLLIHNLFADTRARINGPMWSIAVEFQISLLFPLMLVAVRRWGIKPFLLFLFLFGMIGRYALAHTQFEMIMPHFYTLFGIGMLAGAILVRPEFEELKRRGNWGVYAGVFSMVTLALFCKLPTLFMFHHDWTFDFLIAAVAFPLILHVLTKPEAWVARILSNKYLVSVGVFSYSLYLIHFPLQQLFWLYLVRPMALSHAATFTVVALVGTPLLVVTAYAFHLVAEKPFMSARQKRADQEEIGAATAAS